ncbi:hypothetical protein PRIC2_012763 [Phytophthora ramorum]
MPGAMSAAQGRFDALLTELAQQHGGVESLLGLVLRLPCTAKPDFYVVSSDPARHKMGFQPGQAQQKVLKAFHKYPMKSLDGGSSKHEDKAPVAATTVRTEEPKPQLTEQGKQVPVGNWWSYTNVHLDADAGGCFDSNGAGARHARKGPELPDRVDEAACGAQERPG